MNASSRTVTVGGHPWPRPRDLVAASLVVALAAFTVACQAPPEATSSPPPSPDPAASSAPAQVEAEPVAEVTSEPMEYHGIETLLARFEASPKRSRAKHSSRG